MVNSWGCQLVVCPTGRTPQKSWQQLEYLIKSNVPGYTVRSLQPSGTAANVYAINRATDYNMESLLIGMGAYAGGDEMLQPLSSSAFTISNALSLPKDPSTTDDRCRAMTIALPYHVICSEYTDKAIKVHETNCLGAIHKKLLLGKLSGNPIKALMLEYILGGNGGELSSDFLKSLGKLLKVFGVVVIADEVLTSGRVGPSFTLTEKTPIEFKNQVAFITVGKILDCGMVLQPIPKRPTESNEVLRGSSTRIEASKAYQLLSEIFRRLVPGRRAIPNRRKEALEAMKVTENKAWGRGLLMFTEKTRSEVKKGLKNRLLPMLDDSQKIQRLGCKDSPWTRATVSTKLINVTKGWIRAMAEHDDDLYPFVSALIEFISTEDKGAIMCFTEDWFLNEYLGPQRVTSMTTRRQEQCLSDTNIYSQQRRCKKTAKTFLREAIRTAARFSSGGISQQRKGHKRKTVVVVKRDVLGFFY